MIKENDTVKSKTTKMMQLEAKLIWSYIIYTFLMMIWLVLIWGASGYLVFFMGKSGWWFLLTSFLSQPIMPYQWNALLTGIKSDED